MKVAFWTLGVFILGLLGVVMVNLFGNIAVTDQLNYTTMKNAVQAAMYDSLDIAHYRAGFCLCTDNKKSSDKWEFNDDSEYELLDITYDNEKETCVSEKKNCEILKGEYRLNKQKFSESLIRRFAEMVNNNKDYIITIQDIIEYPPKVSVKVNSKDKEYTPTNNQDDDGYVIVNQLDAIIETKKEIYATPTPEVTPTPTPKLTTKVVIHHYVKGTTTKVYKDVTKTVDNGTKYETTYIDSSKLDKAYKDKYSWDGVNPKNANGSITNDNTQKIEVTYYYKQSDKFCFMRHKDANAYVDDDMWQWTDQATIDSLNKKISKNDLKWMKDKDIKKSEDCHCEYGWNYNSEKINITDVHSCNNNLTKRGRLHEPPKKGDIKCVSCTSGVCTTNVYGCKNGSSVSGACIWRSSGWYKDDSGKLVKIMSKFFSTCDAAYSNCYAQIGDKSKPFSCAGIRYWGIYKGGKRQLIAIQACSTYGGQIRPADVCEKYRNGGYECRCGG